MTQEQWIRERTFQNMVDFYKHELQLIHDGESAYKLLSQGVRATMIRDGILLLDKRKRHGKISLSEKTLKILEEVESNE